ncbi:MAG: hypothetical protein WA190_08785 [Usitatibacter sp.]
MKRAFFIAGVALGGMLVSQCATEGGGGSVEFYGGYGYYDDYWYGGGCCVDYPGDIGPPRPEHPIAKPPPVKPSQPIATPPSRPMPSPRPAAMPRGGGGGRR